MLKIYSIKSIKYCKFFLRQSIIFLSPTSIEKDKNKYRNNVRKLDLKQSN